MIFFIVKMNFSLHLTEIYQNDHKDEKFYLIPILQCHSRDKGNNPVKYRYYKGSQ